MTPALKLSMFVLVLVLVFCSSLAVGAAVGPFDEEPPEPQHEIHPPERAR